MKSLSTLIADVMIIQGIFTFVKRDTLNMQKSTQHLTIHARKNLTMLNAYYKKSYTQPITKVI